jgi:CubicO group peptidase (beta-lactamase class C family)
VTARILKQVGMGGSDVHLARAIRGGNVATPHARVEGTVRTITPFDSDNTNPAGGIQSNAEDMARWVNVQLARGTLADGTRLFSEDTSRQLMTLVTPIPISDPPPELPGLKADFAGYALGLGISDYRGHKIVSHTGGLPGFLSKVAMIPDLSLGVIVLTNQESGAAFNSIVYRVFDHYLKAPATDWIDGYSKAAARIDRENAESERKTTAARDTSSKPSLALAKYAGVYRDDWYGDVEITEAGGKLAIRFTKTPSLTGDLEHWQQDTFVAKWRDRELRADAFVTFALNPDGGIDQMKMRAVSPETDFSFDFQDLLFRPVRSDSR